MHASGNLMVAQAGVGFASGPDALCSKSSLSS
eukprot:COSAG02_NODE_26729_length_626_cov_0.740038_2_plen_31_part_01